jgi:thiol-disulfide isomerase/thioredoxin
MPFFDDGTQPFGFLRKAGVSKGSMLTASAANNSFCAVSHFASRQRATRRLAISSVFMIGRALRVQIFRTGVSPQKSSRRSSGERGIDNVAMQAFGKGSRSKSLPPKSETARNFKVIPRLVRSWIGFFSLLPAAMKSCFRTALVLVSAFFAAQSPATAATSASSQPAPAPGAAASVLTWNDLVRRPELRPATCTVNREFKFQSGQAVRAGTQVSILEVKPNELVVGATNGTNFGVKPTDTNALELANAVYGKLTPEQRALTYAALLQRMDLWPYRVKLMLPFELEGRKTRVGDPATLLKAEGNQLLVRLEGTDIAFNVQPQETDLLTNARNFLVSEKGAPGRMLEELAGKLVNPLDGRPTSLDAAARPKYVVLYMGAGWCGPCQAFSPQLVKMLKEKNPAPGEVATIYLSGDKSPGEMKAYVTKMGIAWPTLRYNNSGQLPAFSALFGNTIPQLVVTDRHGKVVVDSNRIGYDRALAQLKQLL